MDIKQWNGRRAQIECLSCNHHAWLDGFAISDFEPGKLLAAALVDQGERHRNVRRMKSRGFSLNA